MFHETQKNVSLAMDYLANALKEPNKMLSSSSLYVYITTRGDPFQLLPMQHPQQ